MAEMMTSFFNQGANKNANQAEKGSKSKSSKKKSSS